MSDLAEIKVALREILKEEYGLIGDVPLADKWKGGSVVLKPKKDEHQEKIIPLDAFFHKVVMVRDRLRVLEQKINMHKGLSDAEKVEFQQYITKCYGSLTTFNIFFGESHERFQGSSGEGSLRSPSRGTQVGTTVEQRDFCRACSTVPHTFRCGTWNAASPAALSAALSRYHSPR